MKSILLFLCIISSIILKAQTPIDNLQKQNANYLETLEQEGYEFRSQIITEFDLMHATQDVNIKLSEEYTYVVVALGDSNIPQLTLDIRPSKKAGISPLSLDQTYTGAAFRLVPTQSGRFKISISAKGLSDSEKGFISFMVLRK